MLHIYNGDTTNWVTQRYNKHGKIIHYKDSCRTFSPHCVEKIFEYTSDTLLKKQIDISGYAAIQSTIEGNKLRDSIITWYAYAKNILIETRSIAFRNQDTDGETVLCDTDNPVSTNMKKWGDTAITKYLYDDKNRIVEKVTRNKKNVQTQYLCLDAYPTNRVASTYDNIDRPKTEIKQFIYRLNDRYTDTRLSRFETIADTIELDTITYLYAEDNYTEVTNNLFGTNTTTVRYTRDSRNRVIEEIEESADENSHTTRIYKFYPDRRIWKEIIENTGDTPGTSTNVYKYY